MLDMLRTYADRFHPREEGATAVEYGIMVALIAVVIIAAVALLGDQLNDTFVGVNDCLNDAATC